MPTENFEITEVEARIIREAIDSGRFQSISDVVRAGLRLLAEQLNEEARTIEELRALIDEGEASGESELSPREIWDAAVAKYKAGNA